MRLLYNMTQITKHRTGYALHITISAQNRISSSASPSSSSPFTPSTSISSFLNYTKLYLLIPNYIQTLPDYNARATAQQPLVSGLHSDPNTAPPCTEEHHPGFYNLTSLYSISHSLHMINYQNTKSN